MWPLPRLARFVTATRHSQLIPSNGETLAATDQQQFSTCSSGHRLCRRPGLAREARPEAMTASEGPIGPNFAVKDVAGTCLASEVHKPAVTFRGGVRVDGDLGGEDPGQEPTTAVFWAKLYWYRDFGKELPYVILIFSHTMSYVPWSLNDIRKWRRSSPIYLPVDLISLAIGESVISMSPSSTS